MGRGSKCLPNKNIKTFLGKPLIAWTIDQAKKSKYIDKLIVSTNDEEIAKIFIEHGANIPIMRPETLEGDDSPVYETILHALSYLEEHDDVVVMLECSSPMRYKEDIDKR